MKKRLASIVVMFGMLAGVLLATAGTASATGGTTHPSFECQNAMTSGQICENIDNVVVTVTQLDVLSWWEILLLEDLLNDLAVSGINGDVNIIKDDIVDLYGNEFDIPILPDTHDTADQVVRIDATNAFIATLPRDQAAAVLLRVVMGWTPVARVMGKRPGAVRTAVWRGLRKLGEWLARARVREVAVTGVTRRGLTPGKTRWASADHETSTGRPLSGCSRAAGPGPWRGVPV